MSQYTLQLLLISCVLIAPNRATPLCRLPTIVLSVGDCRILAANGDDVSSWGIRVGIGGSNDQCLVPSTVVNDTFVTTSELCGPGELNAHGVQMTTAQCRSRRGGLLSTSLPDAPTEGMNIRNPGWGKLGNSIDSAALATMDLLGRSVTMPVGLITSGQQSTASHLGLASGSVLLQMLKDADLIAARSFGLNVGSQSAVRPRRGSLVLGGYDQASIASSFTHFDISNPDEMQDRNCPLQVSVTRMTLELSSTDSTRGNGTGLSRPIIERADPTRFCIEPYDNLFRMSSDDVDEIESSFRFVTGYSGKTVDPHEYKDRLLNLEPGLVYPASAGSFNATMRLTIEDKLTVEIPFHELQRPLRGLDRNGSVITAPEYNELQVYREKAPGDAPVLGKAFLSQVYLFVDYESGKFSLAPQTDATTPYAVSSAGCDGGAPNLGPVVHGLVAIGVVLGVLIVLLFAYVLSRFPLLTKIKVLLAGMNLISELPAPGPHLNTASTGLSES